ncbi:MATE family efflux transporter [Halarsenatibacter silvermanii]|uniref:Probable multidrug resistance protein NorM n=1 Tax=Halarsenatibacter silvermanii TaxID=321763 RepID=A0A1G9H3L0_9FIRM|nr:MATE family efflux transporter [Halarsenatibacter silvermanii]SDL07425.1 putative efflux protein, MATE family [Halarsenatibacter silvermanii]
MKQQAEAQENIIDRPIIPTMIKLSWPIIVGQGMHLMYQLADTFWIGRLGAEHLAAITLSFPLLFIVFSMGTGFSIAGVSLVSQYTGAEEHDNAGRAAAQVLLFAVLISLLFMIPGRIFSTEMLILIGAEAEVLPLAEEYFNIFVSAIPIIFVYFVFSASLEGIGDTITPMKIKIISVIANIILDPFLIFGWSVFPEMGIAGAAAATVFSRLAAGIVGIYIMLRGLTQLKIRPKHFIPDPGLIKKIFRIGLPAAFGDSGLAIAITVMTSLVAGFGTTTVAAWGIANRVTSMIRMPAFGMGRATGIMVGQHLGADHPDEAGKVSSLGTRITFGFMLILAVLLLIFSSDIIAVFTAEDQVVEVGAEFLNIVGFAYAFLGAQIVLSGALNGAGKTAQQTFFRLLSLWGFQIPFSYLLAYQLSWGRQGIWWGILLAKMLGFLVLLIWFRRGTWKTKEI